MATYLLDCNHLSPALRKQSSLRNRLEIARRAGYRLVTCHPVLCELESGIQQTPKPEENRLRLSVLLKHVRIWPLDNDTTRIYGTVYNELVAKGRVLSQVDMMLAALARQFHLTLLTSDLDFAALSDLRVENWR